MLVLFSKHTQLFLPFEVTLDRPVQCLLGNAAILHGFQDRGDLEVKVGAAQQGGPGDNCLDGGFLRGEALQGAHDQVVCEDHAGVAHVLPEVGHDLGGEGGGQGVIQGGDGVVDRNQPPETEKLVPPALNEAGGVSGVKSMDYKTEMQSMPASITAIASVTATIRPLLNAQRCPSESLNMSVPNMIAD